MKYPMAHILSSVAARMLEVGIEAANFEVYFGDPDAHVTVNFTDASQPSNGVHPYIDGWSPHAANEEVTT